MKIYLFDIHEENNLAYLSIYKIHILMYLCFKLLI